LSAHRPETVLLSLGSNIEPDHHLLQAVWNLSQRVEVVAVSQVFETAPVGGVGPLFLNTALEIRCVLDPQQLKFEVLRPVEKELGRERSADRNAPRSIDVDISLFGQQVVEDQEVGLQIPDPEILTRAHVAVPLADLAPNWVHPVTGRRLVEIAARFAGEDLRVFSGLVLWPQSDKF